MKTVVAADWVTNRPQGVLRVRKTRSARRVTGALAPATLFQGLVRKAETVRLASELRKVAGCDLFCVEPEIVSGVRKDSAGPHRPFVDCLSPKPLLKEDLS